MEIDEGDDDPIYIERERISFRMRQNVCYIILELYSLPYYYLYYVF